MNDLALTFPPELQKRQSTQSQVVHQKNEIKDIPVLLDLLY